jgi:hypothetical protein
MGSRDSGIARRARLLRAGAAGAGPLTASCGSPSAALLGSGYCRCRSRKVSGHRKLLVPEHCHAMALDLAAQDQARPTADRP